MFACPTRHHVAALSSPRGVGLRTRTTTLLHVGSISYAYAYCIRSHWTMHTLAVLTADSMTDWQSTPAPSSRVSICRAALYSMTYQYSEHNFQVLVQVQCYSLLCYSEYDTRQGTVVCILLFYWYTVWCMMNDEWYVLSCRRTVTPMSNLLPYVAHRERRIQIPASKNTNSCHSVHSRQFSY